MDAAACRLTTAAQPSLLCSRLMPFDRISTSDLKLVAVRVPARGGLRRTIAQAASEKAVPAEGKTAPSANGPPSAAQAPKAKAASGGRVVPKHPFQYPAHTCPVEVQEHSTVAALSKALAQAVVSTANAAIKEHGAFTLVISGGSLIKALLPLADVAASSTEWKAWHVFFADERCVALSSKDSNAQAAQELLSKLRIPKDNCHTINDKLAPEKMAADYEKAIKACSAVARSADGRLPRFDLVLLGLGPDGHVASLFPNHPLLAESTAWVAPITNSPKPPPNRITLTLPVLNAAAEVAFVVAGSDKAEVLQRALEVFALPGALPAQLVRPTDGKVTWHVDKAAAAKLARDTWGDPRKFPRSDVAAK